jgi:hypothetical protein
MTACNQSSTIQSTPLSLMSACVLELCDLSLPFKFHDHSNSCIAVVSMQRELNDRILCGVWQVPTLKVITLITLITVWQIPTLKVITLITLITVWQVRTSNFFKPLSLPSTQYYYLIFMMIVITLMVKW